MTPLIWQSFKPAVNSLSSKSAAETEQKVTLNMAVDIDGRLPISPEISSATEVWQTEDLRALLDFYIAYYEQSELKMWQQFNQYCHPFSFCNDLTALFERYLLYKMQLQNLDTDRVNLASEFEDRLDRLNLLRNELFSAREISLLFENEEVWDRYAIQRLRINQDASLTKQQKTQLVQQQITQMPESMKQAVLPTQQLRSINQIIGNTVVNSSDEYNQLASYFGDDAAQRLVAVNQTQHMWLKKIQLFKQRNDDLKQQFEQDTSDYIQALSQLKQQMFEGNEQKRLQVYLANPTLIKQ
ncbi:MAG: lipase chaperone LimK [Bermanella sp.]|jgi:lipase chaperone LimK|uniref:lipase chaperone family protein n=1 Tax=Glaciecola sp. 33A TaxID=2057807 RepID=UPI001E2B30FB|nr:lipase chaperone family protein [Glaciecola sp. 33A]